MGNKRFHTGDVVLLSFSHFVHDLYTSFLPPLLPLIIEKLSINLGEAGFLSTILQVPSLLNPFIGVLADKKGLVKWLVILAPSMTAIPMSLMGNVSAYWMLIVLLFIAGTSVALYHVPAPVLISDVSGTQKGKGMSFFMTGGEAARSVGPIFAVAMVAEFGLENFYPVMIFAIIMSVMLYFRLSKIEIPENVLKPSPLMSTVKEMKHIFIPLSGILTATAFMRSALSVFLPVFIQKQTGSLWLAGTGLAIYEALGIAGVLSAGIMSDRMGRGRILFIALIAAPVTLCLFIITHGYLSFFMLLATGFTFLSTTPVMLAIIQENAGGNPSAANGIFMMVSFVTRAVTVVLVGIIGDFTGLANMYLICAAIGLLALPFLRNRYFRESLGRE